MVFWTKTEKNLNKKIDQKYQKFYHSIKIAHLNLYLRKKGLTIEPIQVFLILNLSLNGQMVKKVK